MARVALIILLAARLGAAQAHDQGRSKTSLNLGKGKATIDYGTPKLGGRNLDEMIKPGTPWRLGMNDPTTLETTVALDFDGKKVPAGKYVLFARPDADQKWVLLVCKERSPASAMVEVPLHFMRESESVDVLKVALEKAKGGGSIVVAWGTYRLHGSFEASR